MDWVGEHLWAVWLLLAVALGAAEMLSLDLVLAMLAVGAVVGALVAIAGLPGVLQVLLAAGSAAAMLALVRPNLIARLHQGPDLVTGTKKLVGQRAVVTERLTADISGRIRLAGEIWSARPYDESITIDPGTAVEVFAIRGATAYVHPVGELMP